jgi:hypothetical protein
LLSPRDCRASIVAQKPSVVSVTSIRVSPFIRASNLLAVFARIQWKNFLGFFTPDTYTGVTSLSGVNAVLHLG